ncbi:MAG: esterase/lipase family protein, partial [Methylocella sp.]
MADGASAAIAVVQTNDCTNKLTLTTTNGTTLLSYDPAFLDLSLKNPLVAGTPSLTIKTADFSKNIGGSYFASALVQAPIGAPAPSFTDIDVAAQQGTQTATESMDMVPPPVILVHGLWGDQYDLGGKDGVGGKDGLAHYLKTLPPWSTRPGLVTVLCYSKYFGFDATADPLGGGVDSCERTSENAITEKITNLLQKLDNKQIVGSRVDIVAHSMGGLAARFYSSQVSYRKLRNRQQGKFHEVITLDTPEYGTQLARFLLKHSDCKFQPFSWASQNFCFFPSDTVAQCFRFQGRPLAAPGDALAKGAVFSLYPPDTKPAGYPPGTSPKDNAIQKLIDANIPANIPGADWRAVSATAPDDGKLKNLLNTLISQVNPSATDTCGPITAANNPIDQILNPPDHPREQNDAIVRLSSQLGSDGDKAHTFKTFPNLSHTGLSGKALIEPGLNDNVLDSSLVWQKVCRWLSSPTNTCPPPASSASIIASNTVPPNNNAGLAASVTPVSASKAPPANKNVVPMPHIVTKHPHFVDRLALSAPTVLELGTRFDLVVNTGSDDLPEIHVVQTDKNFGRTGSSREMPVVMSRVVGRTVSLSVTPEFFGNTTFQVVAAYRDGGVASKDFTTTVNLPSRPPSQ